MRFLPYGVYELETAGDLEEIHKKIIEEHTTSVQSESDSFYPWHELSNAKIETNMTIDARVNRDAAHQFLTPAEKEQHSKELYAELVDSDITFLVTLFVDSQISGEKYVELGTDRSVAQRIVLEVDGEVYLANEVESVYAGARTGFSYVRFSRFNEEGRQVIDENTKLARLWIISPSSRIFFDFSFEPYHGEIIAVAPPVVEKPLYQWSGTGMKNTETFEIDVPWKITWRVSNETFAGTGLLQTYLNDSKGNLVALLINQLGSGGGETWVHNQTGKFYLEISSANCDWEIEVFAD